MSCFGHGVDLVIRETGVGRSNKGQAAKRQMIADAKFSISLMKQCGKGDCKSCLLSLVQVRVWGLPGIKVSG